MDLRQTLADNLRAARERKGLSVASAAAAAGITEDGWRKIETAARWPGAPTLEAVAAAVEVAPDKLLRTRADR